MLLGSSLGLGGLSGDLGGSLGLSLGGLGSGLLGVLSSTLGLLGGLGLSGGLASSLGLGGLGLAGGLGGSGLLELGGSGATELVGEALDASTGVNELLLAGVERVALVAEVDGQGRDGGAGGPSVAAAAADGSLDVIRVDTLLHCRTPSCFAPGYRPGNGTPRGWSGDALVSDQGFKPLNGSMGLVSCHEFVEV